MCRLQEIDPLHLPMQQSLNTESRPSDFRTIRALSEGATVTVKTMV